MLEKIGYVDSIEFEKLKTHLVSCEDRRLKYYTPKTVSGGYQSGESDDCISLLGVKFRELGYYEWSVDKRENVCVFGNHGDLLLKQFYGKNADKEYADWVTGQLLSIEKSLNYYKNLGKQLEVVYETGRFVVVRYSSKNFVSLPKEFVKVSYAENYDSLTVGEVSALLTGGEKVFDSNLTATPSVADVKSKKERMSLELKKLEDEAKTKYELAKKQMEDTLQDLKNKQEIELSVLREQVEKMKDSIFILGVNIFALRSLFGETFSLVQLNSGKSSNESLVINQKFRFLDEEFALLAIKEFGNFDGSHGETTEIFKKKEVQNQFIPYSKCVTFFRTSKDKKYYEYDVDLDGLKALEYYHENQIGMLIRNGENVFLSFIDEEIFIEDENVFESGLTSKQMLSKLQKGWNNEYDYSKDVIVEGKTKLRDQVVKKAISKKMLSHILMGLFNSSNIFPELKNVSLFNSGGLIVFKDVDNQIGYSKYPDFKTYFENSKEDEKDIRIGDTIVVVEKGAASKWLGGRDGYEEHRSRGYQNRARDAENIKCGLHQISFIEKEYRYWELLINEPPYKTAEENGGKVVYMKKSIGSYDEDFKERVKQPNVVCEPDFTFYVSAKRDVEDYYRMDAYGRLPSRVNNVNLKIYNDEFCPVDFINSNYVLYWLEGKNIGNWYKGNYVYLVENVFHYLLKMLKGREEREKSFIRLYLPTFEGTVDELDAVTDWKKQNKVRTLNEFQAKRFVKWYTNK